MAKRSKEERLAEVHEDALVEFDAIHSAMHHERMQCLEDRRFGQIPGAQWEGALSDVFENKPRFEINKTRPSVLRIENEYRNNRVGVIFQPKDGAPNDKLADTCAALFRADEQDSVADEAYDGSFDEAVSGGYGAIRVCARYADEDDEDGESDADEARPQRIRIEHIPDADASVWFDLNAKRQDKSDARSAYVLTSMTVDEYKRRYDEDPSSWNKDVSKTEFDWATVDAVYVAEYYVVEDQPETYITFQGLDDDEVEHAESKLEEDEDLARELEATGYREISRRETKRRRIHKYLLSGSRVLEDCGYIAGRQIPIVPVYGQRSFIDNVERCMGHVRLAKDAQRLLNMLLSKLAEISSMTSIAKPIFTPEQMAGHSPMWSQDNIKNWPYLLVNSVMDASGTEALSGPVGETRAPDVPQVFAALIQLAEVGLKDVLGNPQEAEKMVSHVAGKTVELLQRTLDKQAFIYISNMAKAIRRVAQIWLSMARELYTQKGRKMKGVTAIGKTTQVELMRSMIDPATKMSTVENDLSRAAFDVNVTIGLSSESKRQAAAGAITGLLGVTQDEASRTVLGLFAIMNLEGEGVEDLREWARAQLVRKGAVKPTPEEQQQLAAEAQSAPKDPNATYLEAAADKAKADAAKVIAEIDLTAAKTENTKANTIETLAGVDTAGRAAAIDAAKGLQELSAPQPAPVTSASGPGSGQ